MLPPLPVLVLTIKLTGGYLTSPPPKCHVALIATLQPWNSNFGQVLKRIREYMKEKQLPKDPRDGRKVQLDPPLQKLLGVKTANHFSINKYISKHIHKWMHTTAPKPEPDEEEGSEEEEMKKVKRPGAKKKPAAGSKRKAAPVSKSNSSAKRSKSSDAKSDGTARKPGGFAAVKYHLSPELQVRRARRRLWSSGISCSTDVGVRMISVVVAAVVVDVVAPFLLVAT